MLSIIVPIFNAGKHLAATIESIQAQTFRDFELILVDDGSTDDTPVICHHYAALDSRIHVIHQSNRGVSEARNRGLAVAAGDVIGFVDSDDLISSDMYRDLMEVMELSGAEIVQCRHDRLTALQIEETHPDELNWTSLSGRDFVRSIFTKKGGEYTNQVSLCTKIFKRELIINTRFPTGQTYEDEQETYKICLAAKKIALIDAVYYHYIRRNNSIITGISPRKMLDKQLAVYDRLCWLPPRIPDLEKTCVLSFNNYSQHILCRLWDAGERRDAAIALRIMLKGLKGHENYLHSYDRLYVRMLRLGIAKGLIFSNDFAPIQKLISRIKL